MIEVSDSGRLLLNAPDLGERGEGERVYDLLTESGVPVVNRRRFTIATMSSAARFLDSASGSCVVKRAEESLTGGAPTSDVRDSRTLRIAAAAAAAAAVAQQIGGVRNPPRSWPGRLIAGLRDLSAVPLVIRQEVRGEAYRLLYLDGELVDVVQRAASSSGTNRICLPARHLVSPGTVELGARAAAVVGGRLVGVDVVVDSGLDHAGGRVVDVDTIPRLDLHYHGMSGAVDVARVVLERLAQA